MQKIQGFREEEASLAQPPEGASTGRRDHVAAGGPRPSHEGADQGATLQADQGATLQAAHGTSGWINRMRPGGPTLMGTGPRRGNCSGSVGAGELRTKVTRAGTTVFGTRTSAGRTSAVEPGEARALGLDACHAETLRESLWNSLRWLRFRSGMAGDGDGGTTRVSGSERLEPMTSTDNSRPSDPSRSRIRGMKMESRSRKSHRERYRPAMGVTGRCRPAGLQLDCACPHHPTSS